MANITVLAKDIKAGDTFDAGQITLTIANVVKRADGKLAFVIRGRAHRYEGACTDENGDAIGIDPATPYEVWRATA